MKTKFVTEYYAYHYGPPFWGQKNRENWYKYSIISICNTKEQVVCYTDEGDRGYNQLLQVKQDHNLDNLEIKVFNLLDNPWQDRIYQIATGGKCPYYADVNDYRYYISPQIYWMKWYFMNLEFEPDINLYWIDCGLSHSGLFPKFTNPYAESEKEIYDQGYPGQEFRQIEFKYYHFTKAFNQDFVKRVNAFHDNKIIHVCKNSSPHYNFNVFLEKTKLENTLNVPSGTQINHPVGGFFGGNSNLMPQHIQHYYSIIDKVLENDDYLVADQEIMCYLNTAHPDMFKNWHFTTFYHEDWAAQSCFNEETEISLSWFFTKNLQ